MIIHVINWFIDLVWPVDRLIAHVLNSDSWPVGDLALGFSRAGWLTAPPTETEPLSCTLKEHTIIVTRGCKCQYVSVRQHIVDVSACTQPSRLQHFYPCLYLKGNSVAQRGRYPTPTLPSLFCSASLTRIHGCACTCVCVRGRARGGWPEELLPHTALEASAKYFPWSEAVAVFPLDLCDAAPSVCWHSLNSGLQSHMVYSRVGQFWRSQQA